MLVRSGHMWLPAGLDLLCKRQRVLALECAAVISIRAHCKLHRLAAYRMNIVACDASVH